jgi:hypothetical protein
MAGSMPRVAVGIYRAYADSRLYAEGGRRRIRNAVAVPARPKLLGHVSKAYADGRQYAEGDRRRIGSYAEGNTTPTATLAGCPGGPLRRRHRHLAIGVGFGRRRLGPFL